MHEYNEPQIWKMRSYQIHTTYFDIIESQVFLYESYQFQEMIE